MIDLSLPIDDSAFEVHPLKIERTSHSQGVEKVNRVIMSRTPEGKAGYQAGRRIIKKEHLPGGEFLSLEMVYSSVHSGTHLDYSYHYGSTSEARPSRTAEQIPLDLCYQNGVKIDLRHKKKEEVITGSDLKQGLNKINYTLKPHDIVLLWTGSDELFGSRRYFSDYPGLAVSAVDFLLDKKIKIFGVDTMGIDRPYKFMIKEFLENKNPESLWPVHFHGRKREFIHIERLANLKDLPDYGFKVICFPVKIKKTGAAWSRVAAVIE